METLVAIPQHKTQSHRRKGSKIRRDQFGSVPSKDFGGIYCRSFVAATSAGGGGGGGGSSEAAKKGKRSSPVPITRKPSVTPKDIDESSNSELWAGPAYSNSPPPSSLPIPKFSLRQRRSVSLDPPAAPPLPVSGMAKSAPASPAREWSSVGVGFFVSNAYATENLRRMLNLDIGADN